MKRREMLMNLGAAMVGLSAGLAARAAGPRRRVLFYTKSAGFQHSVITRQNGELGHAEKVLMQMGNEYNVEVVCSKDGGLFTADSLKTFDALAFYTTGDLTQTGTDGQPGLPDGGKQLLLDTVAAGKPVVGFHCATDTFHSQGDQVDPFITLIGGEFAGHGAQQEATQRVVDHSLPGLEELGASFRLHEEWYAFRNINPDIRVLLVNETEGMTGGDYEGKPPFPSTWVRMHGEGRVAYTSMGHREDVWTNPVFQGVTVGLFAFAFGEADLDLTPNLKRVCPDFTAVTS